MPSEAAVASLPSETSDALVAGSAARTVRGSKLAAVGSY